jgi:hypothetical protein
MGALAFAAASMAASRWRCATAARWSCRRICFAMPGPSGRPTSTAGRGFGKSFFDQFVRGTNWSLDKPSPFETARVRDLAPDMSLVSAALIKSNPELKDIEVAEAWGGTIDRTPDTIPVISPIDTMLGFFLGTGFSGHGFGIGPAAGKLAADIVTAMRPLVDPWRHAEKPRPNSLTRRVSVASISSLAWGVFERPADPVQPARWNETIVVKVEPINASLCASVGLAY